MPGTLERLGKERAVRGHGRGREVAPDPVTLAKAEGGTAGIKTLRQVDIATCKEQQRPEVDEDGTTWEIGVCLGTLESSHRGTGAKRAVM